MFYRMVPCRIKLRLVTKPLNKVTFQGEGDPMYLYFADWCRQSLFKLFSEITVNRILTVISLNNLNGLCFVGLQQKQGR
jgi:hypothetical protein